MNIVLIIVDTLRYDYVGANGNAEIETPNLNRLAAQSIGFDRFFCASYPTIPFRTDVMTGRYGSPFFPWKPLRHDLQTIPWALAEGGFATQLIHDTPHLVNGGHNFDWPFHAWTFVRGAEVDRSWINDRFDWPENWGRDPLFDPLEEDAAKTKLNFSYARTNRGRKSPEDWNCARLFRTAADFLKDNARRENFFLWVDCFDPHEPWDAPPEFVLKYDKTPGYDGRIDPRSFQGRNDDRLTDAARARVKAFYAAKTSWMDHGVGQILDALESTGLDKNTAVILCGDHGTNLGEQGYFGKRYPVKEQEGHPPLFIRTPEGDTGRCDLIVQPQDFFATITGLAGLAPPDDIDSHDVLALARKGGVGPRQIALAGNGTDTWGPSHRRDPAATLFTAFADDWVLSVSAKPEDSHLCRMGSQDSVETDHPDLVQKMHTAALHEVDRRGADPALMTWLRSGGEAEWPESCRFYDGWPGPEGFYAYFQRLYDREL